MWTLWESRALCEISKPLWARSVRPQGWQRPHRLRPREAVIASGMSASSKNGGYRGSRPLETMTPGAACAVELDHSDRRSRASLGAKAALELGGTEVVECRMPAPRIVKRLEVAEQLPLGVAVTVKSIREFGLHGREERLHHRVVVAIAPP